MAKRKVSRLGKGLSSLMGQVPVTPLVVEVKPDAVAKVGKPVKVVEKVVVNNEKNGSGEGAGTDKKIFGASKTEKKAVVKAVDSSVEVPVEDVIGGVLVVREIAVELIGVNPYQPRKYFDVGALDGLAASIKEDGVMQPITLREVAGKDGVKYEIVAGERRWRATMIAQIETIPALVKTICDEKSARLALIENIQREDLNPIEKAVAFRGLVDTFGMSHEDVAKKVGQSRASVTNLLRLLMLGEGVKQFVIDGLISLGQAKVLCGVEDEKLQRSVATQCIKESWSVRQLETAVKNLMADDLEPAKEEKVLAVNAKLAHFADLEDQVGKQLGTKVKIKSARKKGAGTLAIDFHSIDQFDGLMQLLKVKID